MPQKQAVLMPFLKPERPTIGGGGLLFIAHVCTSEGPNARRQ